MLDWRCGRQHSLRSNLSSFSSIHLFGKGLSHSSNTKVNKIYENISQALKQNKVKEKKWMNRALKLTGDLQFVVFLWCSDESMCFDPQGADVRLVYVSLCPFSSRSMYAPVTRLSLDTPSFSIRSSATSGKKTNTQTKTVSNVLKWHPWWWTHSIYTTNWLWLIDSQKNPGWVVYLLSLLHSLFWTHHHLKTHGRVTEQPTSLQLWIHVCHSHFFLFLTPVPFRSFLGCLTGKTTSWSSVIFLWMPLRYEYRLQPVVTTTVDALRTAVEATPWLQMAIF